MARRAKSGGIPPKPKAKPTQVFQPQPAPEKPPSGMNPRASNGSPHTGLTTNRQKGSGGAGSGGPTTSMG